MDEAMSIGAYLAEGGRLTNPVNVPPRYRGELLKIMAGFIDSSLAGAAGFADVINDAPGIGERIAATRIVLEKTRNAGRVLRLLGEFGADTARYATSHPWTDRLPRDAPANSKRSTHDMRLSVLNYPLQGWVDAVTMNLVMGLAVGVQLEELSKISYQPLSEAFRDIQIVETRHVRLAMDGLQALISRGEGPAISEALRYWQPRVEAIFGDLPAGRFETLCNWGMRRRTNAALCRDWETALGNRLASLKITP